MVTIDVQRLVERPKQAASWTHKKSHIKVRGSVARAINTLNDRVETCETWEGLRGLVRHFDHFDQRLLNRFNWISGSRPAETSSLESF